MKQIFVSLAFTIISLSCWAFQGDTLRNCSYNNQPVKLLFDEILHETGRNVFYKEADIADVRFSLNEKNISVANALEKALWGTNLYVSPWNEDFVILKNERLISQLPEFQENDTISATRKKEDTFMSGRKAEERFVITVGKLKTSSGAKCIIEGVINEAESGLPIPNATIFINEIKAGAVADFNGKLSLTIKPGNYSATIQCIGYEPLKFTLIINSEGNFTVSLKRSSVQMAGVDIFGDRQKDIKRKDAGLERITVKSTKNIPVLMGERDVLKLSTLLPGIVSSGEGSAGLSIRGGGTDQNAFIINKIPLYNTSHMFGFVPAFNADILKDVDIYKGFVPGQFGGRLSSVFNITARQPSMNKFGLKGSITPVSASLAMETPIIKNVLSGMVSYRSTFSDYVLNMINDKNINNSSAYFDDLAGGINFNKGKIQAGIFGYHSKDKFTYSNLNSYEYASNGASMSVSHSKPSGTKQELTLIYSKYDFSTVDMMDSLASYSHKYSINHYETRLDFQSTALMKNNLSYGLGAILYNLNRGIVEPFGPISLRTSTDLGIEKGLELSAYLSDHFTVTERLNVDAGLRYTAFSPLGPKTVYQYEENEPRTEEYISDSLNFSNNSAIKWYHEPDIRLSFNFETDNNGSVKISFNQLHQNLFMLNNSIAIAPNTQWKLSDYHLKPSKSNQVSMGIFRNTEKRDLEASVEVYYKNTDNYPEFKDGADFLGSSSIEAIVLQGNISAYGVEFFVKRSNKKLDGWLSYTYSQSIIKVDGLSDWYKINHGMSYPANFDIPHIFNGVTNYHFSKRLTTSCVVIYQTGKPITLPSSVFYVHELPVINYSHRNEYRIPDYFRVDASLNLEGNLRKKKLIHSSFSLNVYNLLGRNNPYSVYFRAEKGVVKSYQYSVIGVPIFTFSWMFKLGNYATE